MALLMIIFLEWYSVLLFGFWTHAVGFFLASMNNRKKELWNTLRVWKKNISINGQWLIMDINDIRIQWILMI